MAALDIPSPSDAGWRSGLHMLAVKSVDLIQSEVCDPDETKNWV